MAAVRFMCAYPFVPKGWVPICKDAEEMLGYKMGKWKVKVKHLYCGLALIFTRVWCVNLYGQNGLYSGLACKIVVAGTFLIFLVWLMWYLFTAALAAKEVLSASRCCVYIVSVTLK